MYIHTYVTNRVWFRRSSPHRASINKISQVVAVRLHNSMAAAACSIINQPSQLLSRHYNYKWNLGPQRPHSREGGQAVDGPYPTFWCACLVSPHVHVHGEGNDPGVAPRVCVSSDEDGFRRWMVARVFHVWPPFSSPDLEGRGWQEDGHCAFVQSARATNDACLQS